MAGETSERFLAAGRAAIAMGDSEDALKAFTAALEEQPSGAAYEGIALAHYLMTDYLASISAHERAYAAYRRDGDRLAAARVARMLAWMNGNMLGEWAVRSGWIGRARKLLAEGNEDSAEHGWELMLEAEGEADPVRKEEQYRQANALGRRYGDAALEIDSLGWLGLQLAVLGRVEEGLELLDEAMAAVVAGEIDDLYVIEGTFCGLFWACERFHDVARAEQWVRAAQAMMQRRKLVAVGGYCRAHYGGILTAAGRWSEAEVELVEAMRLFDRGYAAIKDTVVVRLGDLRVRQGRFEEAERLLEGLDQHPDAARPLAVLHLARGNLAVARELLQRRVGDPSLDHDVAGPLLALLVEVELARGDLAAASTMVDRLGAVAADRPGAHFLEATAALARGRLCLARGESDAAGCMRDALASFSLAQMPVELARARLELAKAVATDDPAVAVAEATSALEACQRLKAAHDADAAASLLRFLGVATKPGPRGRDVLTRREAEVLELLGNGLSNADIGDRLYLSRKTVEHHVSRVLAKLGLRNRAEAAAFAARMDGGGTGG